MLLYVVTHTVYLDACTDLYLELFSLNKKVQNFVDNLFIHEVI